MPTANSSSAADAPQPGALKNDASAAADATPTLKDDADAAPKHLRTETRTLKKRRIRTGLGTTELFTPDRMLSATWDPNCSKAFP